MEDYCHWSEGGDWNYRAKNDLACDHDLRKVFEYARVYLASQSACESEEEEQEDNETNDCTEYRSDSLHCMTMLGSGRASWPLTDSDFEKCWKACYETWWDGGAGWTQIVFNQDGEAVAAFATFTPKISWQEGYELRSEEMKKWLDMMEDVELPNTIPNTFVTNGWFVGTALQSVLVEGSLTAMGVSLLFATVVLLIYTRNPLISFLTVLTIAAILAVVVGILVLLGWTLGFLEAMCMIILVGIVMDFPVHVAHCYRVAEGSTRDERVTAACTEMGTTISMAAVTTFVSACVLFGTTMLFFVNFGTFLTLAMVFSLLYALVFSTSLLSICGPDKSFPAFLRTGMSFANDNMAEPKTTTL